MDLKQIAEQLGGVLSSSIQLFGGISAEMHSITVNMEGGLKKYVVRLPRDRLFNGVSAASYEFRVLEMLQTLRVPAPKPVFLDETRQLHDSPYLITSFVEGTPVYRKDIPMECLSQIAEALSMVHRIDTVDMGFLRRLEIDGIVSRNEPALLHGDFWPGNLLWREDTLAAIVDWEDAHIGDPLYDFSIARHDVLMIYGIDAMNTFTKKYREMNPIDYSNSTSWDLHAATRIEGMISEIAEGWVELGRPDLTEEKIHESLVYFKKQAANSLS